MNLKQAQKVVSDYGGFIEYALYRYNVVVFLEGIPESLLPYPPPVIEDAINIVAKYYHDYGNNKKAEALHECHACLRFFKDDEKSILEAVKYSNKMPDLNTQLIKGFRSKEVQRYFLEKVDFQNPDFSSARKIIDIYNEFIKYTHIGLSYIFCQKIPATLLPFPKIHLAKALDTCLISDDKNTEVYTSVNAKLEDYVDAEAAINELIKNFSDKDKRNSIISDIKKYQLKYSMNTLLISELI